MGIVIAVLAMLLMLCLLTTVHEFGHYIVGRIFKVKILEFSIFMGPKIYSHTSKKTGIKYSVRCLPIGGYCAFEGEEKSESPDSLSAKPWYVRACVLVAGAFMNILLALIIIIVIFSRTGYSTTKVGSVNDRFYPISFTEIEKGDKILKYDGKYLYSPDDYSIFHEYDRDRNIVLAVKKQDGRKINYYFETDYSVDSENGISDYSFKIYEGKNSEGEYRGSLKVHSENNYMAVTREDAQGFIEKEEYRYVLNEETGYAQSCTVTHTQGDAEPVIDDISDYDATVRIASANKIGFSYEYREKGNTGFFSLIGESFKYMFTLVRSVYYSVFWLITGNVGLEAVMGPVGLTSVVSDVVTADAQVSGKIYALINMMALVSVNLGVFNLLPLPALDGGKLFLIWIELLRGGKKIDPEKEGLISLIGFILLMILAVVIAGKDIITLIKG